MSMRFSKNIMISLVVHFICITALLMSGFNFSQANNHTPPIKANEMVFTLETASVTLPKQSSVAVKTAPTPIIKKASPKPVEKKKIEIVKKAVQKIKKKPAPKPKKIVRKKIVQKTAPQIIRKKVQPVQTSSATTSKNTVKKQAKAQVNALTNVLAATAPNGTKKTITSASASSNARFNPKAYIAKIKNRIAQHKHYPNSAKRRGIEGRVGLQLSVTANGTIKSLHIIQSSGSKALDKAAIKSVRNALPFVKMAKSITFKFFMKFNLNEG